MQDQTIKQEINSREEIVKKLKAAYKIKDDNPEGLQRKRAEFLAGFEMLGDWHTEQGKMHADEEGQIEDRNFETSQENKLIANRHLLKAVALYNMALASEFYAPRKDKGNKSQETNSTEQLIQEQSQQFLSANQQCLVQKIKSIEKQIVLSVNAPVIPTEQSTEVYWQKNLDAKINLQAIRNQARESLLAITNQTQAVEAETYAARVQQTYHNIATGQQQLVQDLLNDCLQQLPPPEGCIYSIIVLGSLAREEATPYSDFEWAILFQDQGEVRNALHKTYFRRLAELLWIKVLNLGETTSRMMDIEEINGKDEETYGSIPKGFSFDGQMADGCHTPLGNKHHTKASIEEINQNKKLNEEEKAIEIKKTHEKEYELIGTPYELAQFQQNTWEHKRGLSTVLSTVAVIYSNDAVLEHPLIEQYESEMEQIWKTPEEQTDQRTGEVTHQTLIQRRSLQFLAESSESFQFRGGRFDKEAHYFDAKYHLYRLPNMLIDHLASYFGITQQKNLWDRIEAIWGEQGIASNPDAVRHLKRTISTVLTIRSQAYLRKGHRDDHVLMFDPSHPEKNQHLLQTYLGINQKALFEIFFVLIALQFTMEKFTESKGTITMLLKNSYYDSGSFRQAWIYALLLDYVNAERLYQDAIQVFIEKHGKDHTLVAQSFGNLGKLFHIQGKHPEAESNYEEARNIFILIHNEQHIYMANLLNNLGDLYRKKCSYKKAIAFHEKARDIFITIHNKEHISVANLLNMLGNVYQDQGDYLKAKRAYKKAKNIYNALGRDQDVCMTGILNNLGVNYQKQGQYLKAIINLKKSKNILIKIYGNAHISVADPWINLGVIYKAQSRYLKAITAFEEAKRIYIAWYGENHIAVADTLINLATVYNAQRRYMDAITAYEKIKNMYIVNHLENHISVAITLENLGNVYGAQARYREAIAAHEKAKDIFIATHGEQHVSVADTLQNLGRIFVEQKRFREARHLFQQAVSIYQQFNHPNEQRAKMNFALSYLREGNSFLLQENIDIEQAMRCYQVFNQCNESLRILKQPADARSPQSHQQLTNLSYQRNELLHTIEHYQVLLQLAPNDVSVHNNLACMLHIRAQIEKDKGDDTQYKFYLEEAKSHFKTAIGLGSYTDVYTEYALFMWKNREHFQVETIIAMLQQAIKLGQLDEMLNYRMVKRPAVVEQLQTLIDEENSISFKAIHLAYYLLVQIYCEINQVELAIVDISLLAALVTAFNEEFETQHQRSAGQANTLSQQVARGQSEAILNLQQEITKELEKQQRMANKLVELSQAAIEAKQKEISALSAQTNAEVEQQQQKEIKGMIDTQSQMPAQPFSGRSTSPAQLISQFSSVIRPPTAENPSVLQEAQTSEQIAGPDRVDSTNGDTDHVNVKQFTQ